MTALDQKERQQEKGEVRERRSEKEKWKVEGKSERESIKRKKKYKETEVIGKLCSLTIKQTLKGGSKYYKLHMNVCQWCTYN